MVDTNEVCGILSVCRGTIYVCGACCTNKCVDLEILDIVTIATIYASQYGKYMYACTR